MVPHAGLEYSGACAGAVYARTEIPATVVILAPNHTGICQSPGVSILEDGTMLTPLGEVQVDSDLALAIASASPLVAHDPAAHRFEHAIEIQLPFLQVVAPATAVVPMLLAFDDWPRCQQLAAALAPLVAQRSGKCLLLASSDMTHYESVEECSRRDRIALAALEKLDGLELLAACRRENISMCGRAAAAVVVEVARRLGSTHGQVVDYRHSGMVTGDYSDVVAYAALLIP
jgi:AmmeMemoRadiSam system protein B